MLLIYNRDGKGGKEGREGARSERGRVRKRREGKGEIGDWGRE